MDTLTVCDSIASKRRFQRGIKRAIDILAAALGLIIFAPLFAVIALGIWRTMGTPILFRQQRPGLNESPFQLVKFRTMLPVTSADGTILSKSQRVTRLGWFLRRSSLDELPELWAVLRGDLSLVGPRPLLVEYLPYYSERERLRHSVRPGITGLAQVNGRNMLGWPERLEMDAKYVESWSVWLDFRIMALTLLRLVRSSGVARDPGQEGPLHAARGARIQAPDVESSQPMISTGL